MTNAHDHGISFFLQSNLPRFKREKNPYPIPYQVESDFRAGMIDKGIWDAEIKFEELQNSKPIIRKISHLGGVVIATLSLEWTPPPVDVSLASTMT
ncbi:hypothetical protein WG66_014149 [Moniliophthora roreri]|nr:hypothetical protein WG66_014149 [Moniliophthora roreri]